MRSRGQLLLSWIAEREGVQPQCGLLAIRDGHSVASGAKIFVLAAADDLEAQALRGRGVPSGVLGDERRSVGTGL
jgi:hypothetical protein